MTQRHIKPAEAIMAAVGSIFGIWAVAALIGGLHNVNWQVTELMRQWLVASGMIQPIHTLVDFYTHIKGIEYIICVVFFVAFPLFYKYADKQKIQLPMSTGVNKYHNERTK